MSIRSKLALIFFLVAAAFLAMDHGLRRASFAPSFESLDRMRVQADASRAERAFQNLFDDLTHRARDLARSGAHLDEGSGPTDVELIVVIDESGAVRRRTVPRSPGREPLELREFPDERLSAGHPISVAWRADGPPHGLLRSRAGTLMVGSAEVDLDGTPGLLLLCELVDEALLARMRRLAGCEFELVTVDSPDLDERDRAAFESVAALGDGLEAEAGDDRLDGYGTLRDVRGIPIALVHAQISPSQPSLWSRLERYELLSSLAVLLIFPLILLVLIQAVVTGPLSRLTKRAAEIGRLDDASKRLGVVRTDEIGRLSNEFDRMLEKLERSRVDQQRVARFAGRSEVAIGVMHNVGNLANSLGVSAGLVRDRFSVVDVADLRAVHDELVAHQGDIDRFLREDKRGRHTLEFLHAILERMESEIREAREDIDAVVEDVRGITELVQSLEGSKSAEPLVERVDVHREIQACLRLAISSTGIEFELIEDIAAVPAITVDRQRLLETLVAILSNALESMEATPPAERFLVICVDQPSDQRVRISIRDFGHGIERQNLRRIFAPGVSTKSHGSGFGLHLASLAVAELGGSIEATSEGAGAGSTFSIELPVGAVVPRDELPDAA